MTDGRFLSNNSVNCKANDVKFETLMYDSWAYKSRNNFRNRSRGSPVRRLFIKKRNFFYIFGARTATPAPIEVKFCTAKRTHVPLGRAKFHVNRCNADFWPTSKFNTGSLPLRGSNQTETRKR